MADFNPIRLDIARKRRGFTKSRVAEEAGISTRILTAYERGEKAPSALTIAKLAQALRFPPDFFAGGDLDEPPIDGSSFRAFSTLTARQRDQALGSGALALMLSDWIDNHFSLPPVDVPRLQGVDTETAAEAIRTGWGLGERPISNMVHLLEAHGVRVFSLFEECQNVDAFSFWRTGVPYVFLNAMKSAERSRMDAAHELGHLVLHWRGDLQVRDAEQEADAFGSAFLMPGGSIRAEAPRGARLEQLIEAKRRWKVAVANLAYRMRTVGLLTDWQYRALFVEITRRGYRTAEPDGIDRETSQVLDKVFRGLRQEGMTKRELARTLAIPVAELNKIVFGLVMTPMEGEGRADPTSERPDLRSV